MAKSLGAPSEVISEKTDFSKYRFLIAPAYDLADSILVKRWKNYVANGGHLILTCRTATRNRDGHIWEGEWAAPLSDLIGAHVEATDLLAPEKGTEVLATYNNQFYKGKAAVVRHKIGKGSVTYIGVDTDDSKLGKDILREIYTAAGTTTEDYPEGGLHLLA